MRIRHHRGGFIESCNTTKEIEPTMEAIKAFLGAYDLKVEHYCFDEREPWNADCFIITSPRVIAFCDQMPKI